MVGRVLQNPRVAVGFRAAPMPAWRRQSYSSRSASTGLVVVEEPDAAYAAPMTRPDATQAILAGLTARQREVLELMVTGVTNAELARLLGISAHTVKAHISDLLRALKVANRTEAVGLIQQARAQSAAPRYIQAAPAIAVLPFLAGSSPDQLRFAEAVADDLITRLGRRWFPVIARCSSFNAGGPNWGATQLGENLGAQYLVEGSLQRSGNRVRLNARLIEAASARCVWSDTLRCENADLFQMQEELAGALVSGLSMQVIEHLAELSGAKTCSTFTAWESAASAMWHYWKGTPQDNQVARVQAAHALTQDSHSRLALYCLALTHHRELVEQWNVATSQAIDGLSTAAQRFRDAWPRDPWAHIASGYSCVFAGDRFGAGEHLRSALAGEPSSARAHLLYGQVLAMGNETLSAVNHIETAIRLSPRDPELWAMECAMALACFVAEEYERAVLWATRSVRERGEAGVAHGVLASSYALLGERPLAKQHLSELKRVQPGFSLGRFGYMLASTEPSIAARYLAGLRKAEEA